MNDSNTLKRIPNKLEYFLIICLFYITGGAFSYTYYSIQITCIFLFSFFCCLFFHDKSMLFPLNACCILLVQIVFVLIVPIISTDSISTYLAIAMQLAVGLFCALMIPKERFIEKFINIIVVFAAISLVGFGVSLVYPQVAVHFPMIRGESSVDYYNAGIYVFMKFKGYGSSMSLMNRNAGICWEPGCYQAFLNLGLFFLLEREKTNHDRHFNQKFIILALTVLKTVSTLGIIILIILLCVFFNVISNRMKRAKFVVVLLPLALIIGYFILKQMNFTYIASQKFGVAFDSSNPLNVFERISIDRIKYIVSDGHFWFFGMSFSRWVKYNITLWNSIIHSFLCLGIPFTLTQLYAYWRGSKAVAKHNLLLFIILIMCFSTETLFWRIFFNTIAYYGLIGDRTDSEPTVQKSKV